MVERRPQTRADHIGTLHRLSASRPNPPASSASGAGLLPQTAMLVDVAAALALWALGVYRMSDRVDEIGKARNIRSEN